MKRHAIGAVAVLGLLTGCATAPAASVTPAPTVTITTSPEAQSPREAQVGDSLTSLDAWDVCFAHTTTQVQSDLTEWSRYSPDLVVEQSTGFIVTIKGVRTGTGKDFGTVTCEVEGRVGGVVIASWKRTI
jgi:hypothetical protein